MPQIDYPTIFVNAGLPGGSPEVMAASVATPLEKQFTRIAGVTEMTSSSSVGSASVILQFDLNRDINAAARDVQAAINAAAGNLPSNLPTNPRYRKINPADAPILILSMTSDVVPRPKLYDIASSLFAQKLAQVKGVGQVNVGGSSLPAVRVEVNPQPVSNYNVGLDQIGSFLQGANANKPQGEISNDQQAFRLSATDQLLEAKDYQNLIVVYRKGRAGPFIRPRARRGRYRGRPEYGVVQRKTGRPPAGQPSTQRKHYRHCRPDQGAAAGSSGPACHPMFG